MSRLALCGLAAGALLALAPAATAQTAAPMKAMSASAPMAGLGFATETPGLDPYEVAMIQTVSDPIVSPDGRYVAYRLAIPADPLKENAPASAELRLLDLQTRRHHDAARQPVGVRPPVSARRPPRVPRQDGRRRRHVRLHHDARPDARAPADVRDEHPELRAHARRQAGRLRGERARGRGRVRRTRRGRDLRGGVRREPRLRRRRGRQHGAGAAPHSGPRPQHGAQPDGRQARRRHRAHSVCR